MILYTLILTLVTSSGTAVTSVPGFQNAGACMTAGKNWAGVTNSGPAWRSPSYVCVPLK